MNSKTRVKNQIKWINPIHMISRLTSSSTVKWHIYGKNGLIATHTNDKTIEFMLKDHLGSPRVVLEQTISQGGVSDLSENSRYAWHPFGGMLQSYGDSEPQYGFTGQEKDYESGLQNFRARQYHENLGRFFAVDPQGQYHSPYVYAGNNPFMYTDPDGEFAFLIPLAIGAAIGGAGYTASVAFSKGGFDNWDWGALGKSMAIGAVSGVVSAGIGSAFGAVGSNGLVGEIGRAYMHGFANGTISHLTGGDFMTGFAAGGIGSMAGSAFMSYGGDFASSTLGQVGFSSLSGGIGAELSGGEFWRGAATGATVGLLNHALHEQLTNKLPKRENWHELSDIQRSKKVLDYLAYLKDNRIIEGDLRIIFDFVPKGAINEYILNASAGGQIDLAINYKVNGITLKGNLLLRLTEAQLLNVDKGYSKFNANDFGRETGKFAANPNLWFVKSNAAFELQRQQGFLIGINPEYKQSQNYANQFFWRNK